MIDKQREERWPKATEETLPNGTTTSSLKVKFKPWEVDSDYSDTEGMMPAMAFNGGVATGAALNVSDDEF